jgi:hypothetical protein
METLMLEMPKIVLTVEAEVIKAEKEDIYPDVVEEVEGMV